MDKVYFHLPGLFGFCDYYERFLYIYITEREKFNDWAEIGSVYGAPRSACWNGGRLSRSGSHDEDLILNFMKKYGINCRLTFSNSLIEERHLNDIYCNALLEKFYWGHNSIIVNSPILEDYIRVNYPNYGLISSTTKCIQTQEGVEQELSNRYELVVLDYNFNKDFTFLSQLKNKDKCELLINPVCMPNCPRRALHYKQISLTALHEMAIEKILDCPYEGAKFYQAQANPLFISVDDIRSVYAPMGFKHFKIEGRSTSPDDLTEILLYYLVKPEYQLEIRERIYFQGKKDDVKY